MPIERRASRSSRADREDMSLPATRTVPLVTGSRLVRQRTRVDLPAPEVPTMPWIVPGWISRLRPSSARTSLPSERR